MKFICSSLLLLCIFLVACAPGQYSHPLSDAQPNQSACPTDTKFCPDGSLVSRSPPSCDFDACPQSQDTFCDYGSPYRDYQAKSPQACAVIKYFCPNGSVSFSDQCGCGCTVKFTPSNLQNSKVTNN